MKEMIKQYCSIIGYALIGIAFGFAFFYLFLNIYHYQELRRGVSLDVQNDASIALLEKSLDQIEKNANVFHSNNYKGSMDYGSATLLQVKFKNCVNLFHNDTYQELLNKKYLDIKDVYKFQQSYKKEVLNECIVSYFYALTDAVDNSFDDAFIRENEKLLRNYMDVLLHETSYLEKDLYDNSNYYFTTDSFSTTVKSNVKDGFYETVSAYQNAAKFIEQMSFWYASRVGGK